MANQSEFPKCPSHTNTTKIIHFNSYKQLMYTLFTEHYNYEEVHDTREGYRSEVGNKYIVIRYNYLEQYQSTNIQNAATVQSVSEHL